MHKMIETNILAHCPPDVANTARRLCSAYVAYCVANGESAMDFASDLVYAREAATNRYLQCITVHSNYFQCLNDLRELTERMNIVRDECIKQLVSEGYEIAPLEHEAVINALYISVFSRYLGSVPWHFPLPAGLLQQAAKR